MKAAVVDRGEAGLRVAERPVPDPGAGEVRIAVEACGICGGDLSVIDGDLSVGYPRIPGHEIAGTVDAVGADVDRFEPGDRVAVGWHGGHCFDCRPCRRGDYANCAEGTITGADRDGGYAEYTVAAAEAVAAVPDGIDPAVAGPLACAGLTSFNALRNSSASAGDLVAVQGIGGLGHMGLQFADALGFETVALSHSPEKAAVASSLGADHFVDTGSEDAAAALSDLGGVSVLLATAPSADAIESTLRGLAPNGEAVVVAAPNEALAVPVGPLLSGRRSISGWNSGHARDAEDAMQFAATHGIEPSIQRFDLGDARAAVQAVRDGDVTFRAVLEP